MAKTTRIKQLPDTPEVQDISEPERIVAPLSPAAQGKPEIMAFLDMIALSEGTPESPLTVNNGYDVIVTGVNGPQVFTDYSKHPGILVLVRNNPPLYSTAAGRYQLLYRYWVAYCQILSIHDFTPISQDFIAVRQMSERGALALIDAGNIEGAITACSNIWASLPGNTYGQHQNTMNDLMQSYQSSLSKYI